MKMKTEIKLLEDLAYNHFICFREIKEKSLQVKIILNEISLLYDFISNSNPYGMPQMDIRYRTYVVKLLSYFQGDEAIFNAILTMKEKNV